MRNARFAVIVSLFLGCSSEEDPKKQPNGNATIGSAGGTVTADDGSAVLTIPAGALADDRQITMTALTAADFDQMVGGTFMAAYRFEPDGLTFAQPATLTRTFANLAVTSDDETTVPILMAISASGDTREGVAEQTISVDLNDNAVTYSAGVTHFSSVAMFMIDIDNQFDGVLWSFKVQPTAPAEPKVGEVYNLGLRMASRGIIQESVPLTYTDDSSRFEFSKGKSPIVVGDLGAPFGALFDHVIPLSTYACTGPGEAHYRAELVSAFFSVAPYLASVDLPGCTVENPCAVPSFPTRYFFNLARDITCVPGDGPTDPLENGPFSGVIEYVALDSPSHRATSLYGTFSAGGGQQSAFDDFVMARRRVYGYDDDRGADGTCRSATYAEYIAAFFDPYTHPYTFTGKTPDNAASLGLDYLATPSVPLREAEYDDVYGHYDWTATVLDQSGTVTTAGLPVHVPYAAAEPTITLPGYDGTTIGFLMDIDHTPEYLLGGNEVSLTWDATTVPGDHMSIWLQSWAADATAPLAVYECFTRPAAQLFTIPASIMQEMEPVDTDVDFDINIFSSQHTSVTYDGKTLEGFTTRHQMFSERNYSIGD